MSSQHMFNKPYRWIVLMAYFGVVAMSQMLWLNFAPLVSYLQTRYGVSELMVSGLLLSFPLLYVFLSLHSGKLIDKKGYRYVVILGSIISTLFACVRIYDDSFYVLLIGQTGIAIGQPYIINAISKLVSDWFSKEHTATATGIGTVGMLIGMALGLGLTPVLNEGLGFSATMMVFAGISLLLTLVFVFFGKENNLELVKVKAAAAKGEILALIKIRNLRVLLVVCFLALGVFNGLTSWLEPILKPNGINAEEAGLIGTFLIAGGIVGSVIIPGLSDKFNVRKPFLALCCLVAVIVLYPLCTVNNLFALYILGAVMGFFFLPGYALLLSMCEEIAGIEKAGTATGILMLAGNAGAVIIILIMPLVNETNSSWINAVYLMLFLMLVTFITVITGLKETFVKEHKNLKD